MAVSWFAWITLVATALGASIAPKNDILEKSPCGRVWATVHSPAITQANGNLLDAVELNWNFNGCPVIPSKMGLFADLPTSWNQALEVYNISSEEGYIVTRTSLGESSLPSGWNNGIGARGPQCLWPWIGAGNDQIDSYNCLKIQPTWMEDNADKINNLPIGKLVLPGTHNAGAWRFDTEISTAIRDSFVLCQDRSIWAQLVHGIRYFDFRVSYYETYSNVEDRPLGEKSAEFYSHIASIENAALGTAPRLLRLFTLYWLNHNLIRVRPLVPLLREIKEFLDTTNEVIFLDAHHFPIGFYDQNNSPIRNVHAGLLELVQRELGPHIASAKDFGTSVVQRGPTVGNLVSSNKRLLFSYADNYITSQNDWVWPNLPHLWANTNVPEELFAYLDNAIQIFPRPNARNPMHSAMAQTTPNVFDILFQRGSLRGNADAVNRNVTSRLTTRWREHANIISTDFFLGNDVIDISIALSAERGGGL